MSYNEITLVKDVDWKLNGKTLTVLLPQIEKDDNFNLISVPIALKINLDSSLKFQYMSSYNYENWDYGTFSITSGETWLPIPSTDIFKTVMPFSIYFYSAPTINSIKLVVWARQ